MARLVLGIIIGIALSLITLGMFSMWPHVDFMSIRGIADILRENFSYDLISIITKGKYTPPIILAPGLLAWLFLGYVAGSIAKGVGRGIMAGILVVVVDLLLWILFSVISAIDLMSLFQGAQLMTTIGGIVGGVAGGVIGGLLGGISSGKYEEFY